MTDWRASDERDLRRLLRSDERWRGTAEEIAAWLDRVFQEHADFLESDEPLWEVAEERIYAIHGRTAGEPIFDLVVANYEALALKSSRPTRKAPDRRWVGRLGWFAFGFVLAIPSVAVVSYFVARRLAKPIVVEVRQEVRATPDEVWAALGDLRQWPRYEFPEHFDDDAVLEFSEDTKGVGATVKVRTATKEKETVSLTAVERGKSLAYTSTHAFRLDGVVTLKKTASGTEILWKVTQEPSFYAGYVRPERAKHAWQQTMKRSLRHFERHLRCPR